MENIVDSTGNTLSIVKKPNVRELGATGRSFSRMFQNTLATDEYLSTLKYPADITIYEKMARSDAQVKAILLMLGLPIRATQWFMKPKDDSPEAKKISDYIEKCLFGGFGEGLNLGFDDFIKNVTTMFQFGHSMFEKVFEIKDSFIKWKKFAVRPQSTINDIFYDEVGDVIGIEQHMIGKDWKKVNIPISKLLLFSHDMQQGDVRGMSVLRAAYKHWAIKDFLYKIINVGIERNLVGTPVLKMPENYTQDDKALAEDIVTTLRSSEFGGVSMPETFLLEMFEGKRTLVDVLPYINHQDELISKAILAQFMNLGSGSGSSGSFALSSDQSNLFLMMLDSSAKNIANIVNTHAIPEMVNYNFSSNLYPKIVFKPMNSTKLITTLKTLVDGKIVLPDDDLEGYIRDMLDLPDQAKTREEYALEFYKSQNTESEDGESGENTKSKTPIENDSKQKSYTDKIKQDKVDKKMKETSSDDNIDFENISLDYKDKLKELFKKQFIKLNEMAENKDINSLATIKVNYKGELSKLIDEIVVKEFKLSESDIKFKAKSNIISNTISEKVKSIFLNEYIDNKNVDFEKLSTRIMEKI